MIETPPPVPIEVRSYKEVTYNDINKLAKISTKETFPWWWSKYGCEGTQWYGSEPCRDLTND